VKQDWRQSGADRWLGSGDGFFITNSADARNPVRQGKAYAATEDSGGSRM